MLESNNIYLGNCYELIEEIPNRSIDLVYIDIPYEFESGGYGSSEMSSRINRCANNINVSTNAVAPKNSLVNHSIKKDETGIDYSIYDELCRVMKEVYIYIWLSKNQIPYTLDYFVNQKDCYFDILTWHKTNPIPATNNTWLPDTEYCLFFREKNAHRLNDSYALKRKWYVSSLNVEDKKKYGHPTIKPLELVKQHILHATKEGDIVLDCFAGSDTTCVAAKETNRRYIGIELNEEYYNIAKNRINDSNWIYTPIEKESVNRTVELW